MNKFDNISPIDFRYYGNNQKLFDKVNSYLSEKAFINYFAKVELALVTVLYRKNLINQEILDEIEKSCNEVTSEEVYEEESKIKHNVRALVNCIRKKVSDEAKPYIHLTATSHDIICTAESLRLKDVVFDVILPELLTLHEILSNLAIREKSTLQIGRTHGQHAVPITFGYAIAEYVARLGEQILKIKNNAYNLRGKLSGAVGAYNASSLLFDDPFEFEREVLAELKLKPATHSTQVLSPEFILDLTHSIISCYGILANLSDDMRHLQRSEILEVAEEFGKDQVGSSTMPHKRNPINFENVKSMWKVTMPKMFTLYSDQISEHQRDLTNSASSRFIPEIYVCFLESVLRLNKQMSKLIVDKKHIQENFDLNKNMIIAEPLYILLAYHNHPDAHEIIRKLTLQSQNENIPLPNLVLSSDELKPYIEKLTEKQREIISNPEKYIGKSIEKVDFILNYWKERLNE